MPVDNVSEEGRRALAWRRLLDAALRHGAEVIAREEAEEENERPDQDSGPATVGTSNKGDEDNGGIPMSTDSV